MADITVGRITELSTNTGPMKVERPEKGNFKVVTSDRTKLSQMATTLNCTIEQLPAKLERLRTAAKAVTAFDASALCSNPNHKPLRDLRCGYCQLAARIETLEQVLKEDS